MSKPHPSGAGPSSTVSYPSSSYTLNRPSVPSRVSSQSGEGVSSDVSSSAPPGTTSNRPPPLTLDTTTLSIQHPQPSSGRSTDVQRSHSRSSSPVQRYQTTSPVSAGPSVHHHFPATTTTPSTAHHLRQSHTPSSPPSPPTARTGVPPERPVASRFHSHLIPVPPTSWLARQQAKCRNPQTGRWEVPVGLTPYMPVLAWAGSSLGFVLAFTIWKKQTLTGLDNLAGTLAEMGLTGQCIMGFLIFVTTIPPLPLYSSLIILSGYAFGAVTGFFVSYIGALTGAVVVFLLSRYYLRAQMVKLLSRSPSMARVVYAIERKPSLLFLIRLAPYPYNVMNTVLASSRTLSLTTYTLITALSLFKVIIHTTIGASIKSWSDYHADTPIALAPNGEPLPRTPEQIAEDDDAARGEMLRKTWSVVGIGLCILLFIYLTIVARRAVDLNNDPASSSSRPGSPINTYARLPMHDSRDQHSTGGAGEGGEMEEMRTGHDHRPAGLGRVMGGGNGAGGGREHPPQTRMSISGLEDMVGFGKGAGGGGSER